MKYYNLSNDIVTRLAMEASQQPLRVTTVCTLAQAKPVEMAHRSVLMEEVEVPTVAAPVRANWMGWGHQ
jgi:hypothetical protein